MNPTFSHKNSWQTQNAKAHFSELIKKAIQEGDQFITHYGDEVAVVISKSRYDALLMPEKSLIDFFHSAPYPTIELDTKRSSDLPREVDL
jgi:prevent-host-death family protein